MTGLTLHTVQCTITLYITCTLYTQGVQVEASVSYLLVYCKSVMFMCWMSPVTAQVCSGAVTRACVNIELKQTNGHNKIHPDI